MTSDPGRRRYRRFVLAFSVVLCVALGVGLGSFGVLTGWWEVILLLLVPLAIHVVARIRGNPGAIDPAVWAWPVVALVVAPATFVVVSPDLAGLGLGLGVAAWFALLVVGGVLEVVFDPDGTIAGTTE
jgi:uncharacterized membrane protein YgaE (UPF0421/DUF939 family)